MIGKNDRLIRNSYVSNHAREIGRVAHLQSKRAKCLMRQIKQNELEEGAAPEMVELQVISVLSTCENNIIDFSKKS